MKLKVIKKNKEIQGFVDVVKIITEEVSSKLKETNIFIDEYLNSHQEIIPEMGSYFFSARGKQLRPLLCLYSSKMINKNYNEIKSDIFMASALEFIHSATLLHDDVIDNGLERRGKKSVNAVWGNKHSILLGDYMFSKSFKLMTKSNSLKAMMALADVSAKISEGEFLQLTNEKNIDLSIQTYLNIIRSKTGELFSASFKIPAILTDKSDEMIEELHILGMNFGIIFQILDDLLDYYGSKETGKMNGQDFYDGKISLPIIILIQKSDKETYQFLKTTFLLKERTSKQLDKVTKLLKKNDIDKEIKKHLEIYINRSEKILNNFNNHESEKLKNLITSSINRYY
ncbi:polyprenyl synthetase family protein [Alphaproteobacteria bacterium]|nr:polyprenyl synthetase family protein [Alphaproteobacteria bacterium]